jgi:CheY-like chemotaxis protein
MDLQMPEMNGFEATDHIRKVMRSDIPIIALTADVTTVDVAKCKAVGMNDYIAKPVDERLLYSKMIGLTSRPRPSLDIRRWMTANHHERARGTSTSPILPRRTKANTALMIEMIDAYLEQTPRLW